MANGCEARECPDYKDGKCHNEEDYVSSIDGEPMCPHNDLAIPRPALVEAKLIAAEADLLRIRKERDAARRDAERYKAALEALIQLSAARAALKGES